MKFIPMILGSLIAVTAHAKEKTSFSPYLSCLNNGVKAVITIKPNEANPDYNSEVPAKAHIHVVSLKSKKVISDEVISVRWINWPKGTRIENGTQTIQNDVKGMTVYVGISSFDTVGDIFISNKSGKTVFDGNEEDCSSDQ